MSKIDFTKVSSIDEMMGDDAEDTRLLNEMALEAKKFLTEFKWCKSIKNQYFGLGVGGVVGVFLFEIVTNKNDIDSYIWVINGDLPPLYLTTDDAPNPACALDSYIGAMEDWAKAAIEGVSVSDLVPVDAKPTKQNGELLLKRLKFLDEEILKFYMEDLK